MCWRRILDTVTWGHVLQQTTRIRFASQIRMETETIDAMYIVGDSKKIITESCADLGTGRKASISGKLYKRTKPGNKWLWRHRGSTKTGRAKLLTYRRAVGGDNTKHSPDKTQWQSWLNSRNNTHVRNIRWRKIHEAARWTNIDRSKFQMVKLHEKYWVELVYDKLVVVGCTLKIGQRQARIRMLQIHKRIFYAQSPKLSSTIIPYRGWVLPARSWCRTRCILSHEHQQNIHIKIL